MEQALRYNQGKPQWSQLHFESLEPLIRVLEHGENKYFKKNWQNAMDPTKILESAQRHLAKTFDGELYDEESKQLHIAHVMANCMFWIYHYNKKENEKTDYQLQIQFPTGGGSIIPSSPQETGIVGEEIH